MRHDIGLPLALADDLARVALAEMIGEHLVRIQQRSGHGPR